MKNEDTDEFDKKALFTQVVGQLNVGPVPIFIIILDLGCEFIHIVPVVF